MKKLSLAVPALMIVAACAPPGGQGVLEIAAGSATWQEALNAGDVDALAAVYTDDAHILPPNAAPARGHGAVREIFGGMIEAGLGGTLTTLEVAAAVDIGHHVGAYEITAGDQVVDRGKFTEIWRQQDGEWKIAADIWNSDLPAAAAGAMLIGTHEVEDADVWLAAWQGPNGRRADFAAHGAPSVRVFRSPENPNFTGLAIQVEDMAALTAWLESEEGAQAKAEDGVIDSTLQILIEVE